MRWRRALIALCAIYLLIGPIGKQMFGARLPMGFQTWRMFTGTARKVCQIDVKIVRADGSLDAVNIRSEFHKSRSRWRFTRREAPILKQRICSWTRRKYPDSDVRIRLRCGSRRRWITEDDGSQNSCPGTRR